MVSPNHCSSQPDGLSPPCLLPPQVFTRIGAIEKQAGGGVPTLLRTHPMSDARVTAIEAHEPEVWRPWGDSQVINFHCRGDGTPCGGWPAFCVLRYVPALRLGSDPKTPGTLQYVVKP